MIDDNLKNSLEQQLSDNPMKSTLVEQLLELHKNWEENKDAASTQDYYRALSSLKQFHSILKDNITENKAKQKTASRKRK